MCVDQCVHSEDGMRAVGILPFPVLLVCVAALGACGNSQGGVGEAPGGNENGGDPATQTVPDSGSSAGDASSRGDDASGDGDAGRGDANAAADAPSNGIQTVFLIMLENHSWSTISTSDNAPYINKTLIPAG